MAIVFDLDGTLLDLEVPIEAVREEIRAFFRRLGHDAPMRPILSAIKAAATACAAGGEKVAELEADALAILDAAEVDAAHRAELRAGIDELTRLPVSMALLTNNGRACAEVARGRLAARAIHISAVVTRDEAAAKPSPEGLARVWQELERPGELVFVGDSPIDVAAGLAFRRLEPRADLVLVGLSAGTSSAEGLADAGADLVLGDLAEFVQFARGWLARARLVR